MFTNFAEKNKDVVIIRELDSTTLQLLVNFIYSGKIIITEKNVQVIIYANFDFIFDIKMVQTFYYLFLKGLLPAANILQLNEVSEVCCEFLQKHLCPTNCLSLKAFADLHNCTQLLTSSESYIQHNFLYELLFMIMIL